LLDLLIIDHITGHRIGNHKWNAKRRTGYVYIPKCATTSIRKACLHSGYVVRHKINKRGRYVAVIREPWERYCSGVAQYVEMHHAEASRSLSFAQIVRNVFIEGR